MCLIKPLHHVLKRIEAVAHCEHINSVYPFPIGPHDPVAVNVDVPGKDADRFFNPLALRRSHTGEEIQFISDLDRPFPLRSDRLRLCTRYDCRCEAFLKT